MVRPGVWWIRLPLPFALDHINVWALEDGDGWTLVDTGFGIPPVQTIWRTLSASLLRDRPVHRILVTHYHPDHIGLAAWLSDRFEAPVWMTESEFLTAHLAWSSTAAFTEAQLRHFKRHGLSQAWSNDVSTRAGDYKSGVPALPDWFQRIRDGDRLNIGEHEWTVQVGYGHAPEHACLYSGSLGLLISGDQVLPRISTNVGVWATEPEGDPLGLYLDSLDRLKSLPGDVRVLPSHGWVFDGLHARIGQLEAHHSERLAELIGFCSEPRSAGDVLPLMFRRELDPHTVRFAMGEAIAHLNHLYQRGEMSRHRREDGIYTFQTMDSA